MPCRWILSAFVVMVSVARANAQNVSDPRAEALSRARQFGADGEMTAARALIDSLLTTIPADSIGADELLFMRASFAEDIQQADSDYRRIIGSFRTSPRREASLFRLAQQALISGDLPGSRRHLQQISSEYRADSAQARVSYWLGKTFIESGDTSSACAANSRALGLLNAADPALRSEIESQAVGSCAHAAVPPASTTPGKKPGPSTTRNPPTSSSETTGRSGGRYSVQLAAFPRKPDAEEFAAKLRKSGLDARVDGSVKPFRVRVGRYSTYTEAVAAQRSLKAKQLSGFVTEVK